ncbi:hypothetical protein HYH03_005563 [Edaphochlamys debaryana]|uniref:Uncharacterized protein n=1 Tax=Edaphochlamys debaryana TaxID=47281 RepID=A0A836C260_9CHLO|nr:hypothetical protein HYH03_005563 [Edaphochlamys debaryana]|eukprot:KAG2496333.1 hypothetical protein HYH03_005563 [Edaphochlamys debaryana]
MARRGPSPAAAAMLLAVAAVALLACGPAGAWAQEEEDISGLTRGFEPHHRDLGVGGGPEDQKGGKEGGKEEGKGKPFAKPPRVIKKKTPPPASKKFPPPKETASPPLRRASPPPPKKAEEASPPPRRASPSPPRRASPPPQKAGQASPPPRREASPPPRRSPPPPKKEYDAYQSKKWVYLASTDKYSYDDAIKFCSIKGYSLIPFTSKLHGDASDFLCVENGRGCWMYGKQDEYCAWIDPKGKGGAYAHDCKKREYAVCYGNKDK